MGRRRRAAVALFLVAATAGCGGGARAPSAADDPMALPSTSAGGAGRPTAAEPEPVGPSGYRPPTVVGTLADPAIPESSGLVASRRRPGLLWTHNDSGDGPLLYCLDARIGGCGVWRVTGAEAFDWEDIAAGPGPRPGEPYLYVGDIGDNIGQRTEIVVYRIPEPDPGGAGSASPGSAAAPTPTPAAEAIRLRYPDGAHDAEALLVHPLTGDLYVVVKHAGDATVYKAPAPLGPAGVVTLRPVGAVRLGAGARGPEVVTGGDIDPDGSRVALSSYTRGYELVLPPGAPDFDAVWAQEPRPVALGPRLQGEAIAYRLDGRALITTSERVPSPVHQVERG